MSRVLIPCLIRTVWNLYQTYSVKYLRSDSYRVWKVMMLKARWGGKRSLFPQYPAGFGLTRPEPAHPAQPAGHPDKRIQACESLNTLSSTLQMHLCKACWNPLLIIFTALVLTVILNSLTHLVKLLSQPDGFRDCVCNFLRQLLLFCDVLH